MIPHEPESLKAAKARYPDAIEPLFDQTDSAVFIGDGRPGAQRRHIFDFEDGLRLIISREKSRDGEIGIHISASFWLQSTLHGALIEMGMQGRAMEHFQEVAVNRWRDLSNTPVDGRLRFVGWSSKGVPHWMMPLRTAAGVH